MMTNHLVSILVICCIFIAVSTADSLAQTTQPSASDSASRARPSKSVASKSYAQKSYQDKELALLTNLKYSRMYAASDQCAYETNKGLRCKRKSQAGAAYCRQHSAKQPAK